MQNRSLAYDISILSVWFHYEILIQLHLSFKLRLLHVRIIA